MMEELARLVPTDAAYGGHGRHLAALLFALPLLAVPLSVIANRGLVPFAWSLPFLVSSHSSGAAGVSGIG
jgi:hypothetical protein